ncbi:C45 family peptidase [Caulobacter mirabilis]|uniref:C45 family peptidase n=1 Tax=Caulobacter mirabilis TaxID=69666 RepID=UPI0015584EC3|nr:C45 family peptidase [Caulobacter mirabilis]
MNAPGLEVVARSGLGTLAKAGRLHVLTLEGEPYDLGFQHGELLKRQIAEGCAPVFGAKDGFDGLFAHLTLDEAKAARGLVDGLYVSLVDGLDEALKAELSGLADGAEIPFAVLSRATFRSEILQILAAFEAVAGAPGECTALVALAGRTQAGRLLHAKNQDYDGAGLWDAAPTVTLVRTPGALPHVRVGAAGLLKASFGMNAAGLSVGGHLLFSRHAHPVGAGFTALEHRLLRGGQDIEAARRMLESGERWGAFAFVLGDGDRDQALVLECDSQGVFARAPIEGMAACANHFSGAAEGRDLLLAGGQARGSLARLQRALRAGEEPELTPDAMARMLADRFDPCCGVVRSLGQTIAGPLTVMSAVAEPASRRLWVSQAEAPTCDGPYVGFDFTAAFDGGDIRLVDSLEAGVFSLGAQRAALRVSLSARRTLEAEGVASALPELEKAVAHDPADAAHRRILGRALLKLERFADALAVLELASAVPQSANERAETAYLAAIALDGLGRRSEAAAKLEGVLAAGSDVDPLTALNPRLAVLARRHLEIPFDQEHARRLPMGFTLHSGVE